MPTVTDDSVAFHRVADSVTEKPQTEHSESKKPAIQWDQYLINWKSDKRGNTKQAFKAYLDLLHPPPVKCPKCGKFACVQSGWTEERDPGIYCDSCKWSGELGMSPPEMCSMDKCLCLSVIELVRVVPENETVRALVLAVARQPIPKRFNTFDSIKYWFDHTCDFTGGSRSVSGEDVPFITVHGTNPVRENGVGIDCRLSDREYGYCDYFLRREARNEINISDNDLLELIRHNPIGSDAFFERLATLLENSVRETYHDLDWETREEGHDDYEWQGNEDLNIRINNPMMARDSILQWARIHHPEAITVL